VVATLGLCLATAAWLWQQEQAAVYELDDYYMVPIEEIAAVAPVVAPPVEASERATSGTPRPRNGSRPGSGGTSSTAPVEAAAPSEFSISTATSVGSVGLGGGLSIDLSRPDLVLTTDDEIYAMVKQVINRSSPQLTNCYQQRLKQLPDLAGAWKVEFTITETGGVDRVGVSGQGRSDAEMEACIVRSVGSWRFTKIAHDQPVAKTYRFKPTGG
jgi:hypothetical protein